MGDVVSFRRAKLTGFIPYQTPESFARNLADTRQSLSDLVPMSGRPTINLAEPTFDDRPCDTEPPNGAA